MFMNFVLLAILFLDAVNLHPTTTVNTDRDISRQENVAQSLPSLKLFAVGNNKYYYVVHALKGNWFQALQFCNYNNMDLLSIETQEENDLLWKILYKFLFHSSSQEFRFWTSGTTQPDNVYVWLANGKPIIYANWFPGQPDHSITTEKCIEARYAPNLGSIKWNDLDCTIPLNVICETSSLEKVVTTLDSNVNVTNVF